MPIKNPSYFEPLLAAAIAGIASHSIDGGLIKPLTLAFVGGAVGWMGKLAMSSLFHFIKRKIERKK